MKLATIDFIIRQKKKGLSPICGPQHVLAFITGATQFSYDRHGILTNCPLPVPVQTDGGIERVYVNDHEAGGMRLWIRTRSVFYTFSNEHQSQLDALAEPQSPAPSFLSRSL